MKKQTFLKGSLILMISAVLAKLFGALFKIPLTNMLGGIGMSYFSCAYSLFMPVYALTVTGISSAVARATARSAAFGMWKNVCRIRNTAMMIFSAAGFFGSLIILLLAKPFCVYSADSPESSVAVMMIAPAVLFGCITAVERGYCEGMSNMYPTAVSQVIEGSVKAAAGLILCSYVMQHDEQMRSIFPEISDIRAVGAAAGILGVTLSSLGAAIYFGIMRLFRKHQSEGETAVQSRREIARELISTSLPVGLSAVVTNLTALIDMWTVIGILSAHNGIMRIPEGVSEAEFPHFVYGSFAGIALTVFNLVPSVTNMLGKGTLICITEAWERKDIEGLRRRTMQALLTAAVISIPAAVGTGVLSAEILGILFPGQTDETGICIVPLQLLMPGMVFLCISYPLFSMLQAIGKPSVPLKIMLAGAGVKLAGNILLLPVMGVDGAALSTSLCYGIILIASLGIYIKNSGVKIAYRELLLILYAGGMCGGMAFFVSGICASYSAGGILRIAASAIAGGAVYIGIIIYQGDLSKEFR